MFLPELHIPTRNILFLWLGINQRALDKMDSQGFVNSQILYHKDSACGQGWGWPANSEKLHIIDSHSDAFENSLLPPKKSLINIQCTKGENGQNHPIGVCVVCVVFFYLKDNKFSS